MGVIGGGVFQAIKGFRNAPAGVGHRLRGSANAVRMRAPQIGGSFAVWGGALLHHRLRVSSLERERGSLELYNKWSTYWGHPGSTQWAVNYDGLCHDGRDSARSN